MAVESVKQLEKTNLTSRRLLLKKMEIGAGLALYTIWVPLIVNTINLLVPVKLLRRRSRRRRGKSRRKSLPPQPGNINDKN